MDEIRLPGKRTLAAARLTEYCFEDAKLAAIAKPGATGDGEIGSCQSSVADNAESMRASLRGDRGTFMADAPLRPGRSGPFDAILSGSAGLGLFTDLYELTMACGYWSAGLADKQATFDLFFRQLPPHRNFMVTAGLQQAAEFLLNFRFNDGDVEYLQSLSMFQHASPGWFESLRQLRFTGDLWAIPEGTIVFAGEPLLRVTGPLMTAQIIETYLLTALGYPTSVATKAARIAIAARGRDTVDFGTRRGHGPQAGVLAARASFIGGCCGTSNTLAANQWGIPPLGTMAHAWVMVFEDEQEAFRRFAQVFPQQTTLLIDTYDTLEGARNAIRSGAQVAAVRLDSGDLVNLSKQVRGILDEAGCNEVKIFASGDLNEYKIDQLLTAGSPIDAFGVGTELATVADAPSLSVVYKLVEVDSAGDHTGRIKLSSGKRTYPGRKQVYRESRPDRVFVRDVIGLEREALPGEQLLEPIISGGQLVRSWPTLDNIQELCRSQVARLPPELRALDSHSEYRVAVSAGLQAEFDQLANCRRK